MAVADDLGCGIELVHASREGVERHEEGALESADLPFLAGAHVQEDRPLTLREARVKLNRRDLSFGRIKA